MPASSRRARRAAWVQIGGQSVDEIAFWLGVLDADFEVVDSPDLAAAVRRVADRYARAAS